jgi:dethiobiotin synthetase
VADLAVALALPVLVVARAGLGTVNHSALTIRALRSYGLDAVGVVLNGPDDESTQRNARLIEELAETRVLGHTPWVDAVLDVGKLVADNIDLDALIPLKEVARV